MQPNLALTIAFATTRRSQRDVAAASGVPENRVSSIKKGWVKPRPWEREAIAKALGRTVEELFGHQD